MKFEPGVAGGANGGDTWRTTGDLDKRATAPVKSRLGASFQKIGELAGGGHVLV